MRASPGRTAYQERPYRGFVRSLLVVVSLTSFSGVAAQQGVVNTKHNLSTSGTGTVVATVEQEVCIFCHTPHSANQPTPLWNRQLPVDGYVPYDGASVQASIGQPNGSSKLCLSCHDGTIALGSLLNVRGAPDFVDLSGTEPDGSMPAGSTRLGTNLLNDHPVSFRYDAALQAADQELTDPGLLSGGSVRLYPGESSSVADAVQCSSCHDPHSDERPMFLRKELKGQVDNLCLTCHQKTGWGGSSHEASTEFWPAGQTSEQLRDHSCSACHDPHAENGAERLLRNGASGGQSAIEEACYTCHRSGATGGIAQDIESEFSKAFGHPVTENPGEHRPVFIPRPPTGLPENVLLNPGSPAEDSRFADARHVECVDCHNPHRVMSSNRTEGMRGIAIDGSEIQNVVNDPAPADGQPSDRQYPVCLRCHGDTYSSAVGTNPLASGAIPSNKRVEFQVTNSAFHPVAGPGRNNSSNLNAQLSRNNLSTSSVIKCTDCHNSNAYENISGRTPSTGSGSTPVGPHGSTFGSILRARYWSSLPGPTSWNSSNFDLCFGCHDVNRLVVNDRQGDGSRTNFYDDIDGRDNLHTVHLMEREDDSGPTCATCHYDIHSNVEAPNTQYRIDGVVYNTPPDGIPTRLVSFHPNILPIGGRAKPEWWFNTSSRERRCYLQCHRANGTPGGEVMNGEPYRPSSGDLG